MKISYFFAWFDMWIGAYYDTKKRIVYLCPLPMFVLKIELPKGEKKVKTFIYLPLGQMSIELGWFPGNKFRLFEVVLFGFDGCLQGVVNLLTVVSIQVGKLSFGLYVDI